MISRVLIRYSMFESLLHTFLYINAVTFLSLFNFLLLAPSGIPTLLTTTALSPSVVLATWYEPLYSEQNGVLTKYRVTWKGLERDRVVRSVDIPVNSSSNTSYALTGLDAHTSYVVNVSSFTSVGSGPISSRTVTTLEDSECSVYS